MSLKHLREVARQLRVGDDGFYNGWADRRVAKVHDIDADAVWRIPDDYELDPEGSYDSDRIPKTINDVGVHYIDNHIYIVGNNGMNLFTFKGKKVNMTRHD